MEAPFCSVEEPTALAELLAAMPETQGESDTHKPNETSPLLTGNFLHPIIFSGTALVGAKLNKLRSHLLPTRCQMQPGANCSVLQMLLLPGSDNEVL